MIDILSQLSNTHTLRLLHCSNSGLLSKWTGVEKLIWYYITQIYSKEDLSLIIECSNDGIQENIAKHYSLQLCDALDHLHSKGITYAGLNQEDIRFTTNCHILLISNQGYDQWPLSLKWRGTEYNNPVPESITPQSEYIGWASDVYLLGNVIRGMTLNDCEYADKRYALSEEYKLIKENNMQEYFDQYVEQEIVDYIPSDLQELLSLCLQPLPYLRPSILELTQHPWLTENLPSLSQNHNSLIQEFWNYIIWSTSQDSEKADFLTPEFKDILGLRRIWKDEQSQHWEEEKIVQGRLQKGYFGLVWKDENGTGESQEKPGIFGALCAFVDQNLKKCNVNRSYHTIEVLRKAYSSYHITLSPYKDAQYIWVLFSESDGFEDKYEYQQLCRRLREYLGSLVTQVLNEEKIEELFEKEYWH